MPALFFLGLLLIPRNLAGTPARGAALPKIDCNVPEMRARVLFVAAATLVSVSLLSFASYGAVEYSERSSSAGSRARMEPQFVAHQSGPHGRGPCVSCHIEQAPGLSRAKFNGTRQLHWWQPGVIQRRSVPACCRRHERPSRASSATGPIDHGDVIKSCMNTQTTAQTPNKDDVAHACGGPIPAPHACRHHWHMNRGNQVEYIALDSKPSSSLRTGVDARRPDQRVLRRKASLSATGG